MQCTRGRVLVLAAGFWLVACGKPATSEDCERIVQRITELELKKANVVDPTEVHQEVERNKNAFRDQAMSQCVGKRISSRALECVNSANSAEQIVNECFD